VAARNPPCARPSLAGFNEAIRIIQNFSASRHIGGIYSLRKHSAQFSRRSPSARAFSVLTSTAPASTALFLYCIVRCFIFIHRTNRARTLLSPTQPTYGKIENLGCSKSCWKFDQSGRNQYKGKKGQKEHKSIESDIFSVALPAF